MLFYREKLILSLLEEFGGSLGKTQLQKYLFLLTKLQKEPSYDFIPYNFGCYSFQANKDLEHLQKDKLVIDNDGWKLITENKRYKDLLDFEDRKALVQIRKTYKNLSTNNLIRSVYLKYPYYTIYSSIKDDILTKTEQENINRIIEKEYNINASSTVLFTIGYESLSFETYLNKLITNNIKVLIDVRRNPFSHKFGFSKNTLENVVTKVGIKYVHIPELGIISEKRQKLETLEDYMLLFNDYEQTLSTKNIYLEKILKYLQEYNRVALTCFEKDVRMCHRTRIKDYIIKNLKEDLEVIEL